MTLDLPNELAKAMERIRKGLEPLSGAFAGLTPPPSSGERLTVTVRRRRIRDRPKV